MFGRRRVRRVKNNFFYLLLLLPNSLSLFVDLMIERRICGGNLCIA